MRSAIYAGLMLYIIKPFKVPRITLGCIFGLSKNNHAEINDSCYYVRRLGVTDNKMKITDNKTGNISGNDVTRY